MNDTMSAPPQPQTDTNIVFWCWYLRNGQMQQQNRKVNFVCSSKYLRLAQPGGGNPNSFMPFIPNTASRGFQSVFQVSITTQYRVEYNLELARMKYAPSLPSRFSAIFLFDNEKDAKTADERYLWSANSDLLRVRPTHTDILCQYSRHDMEWVSIARSLLVYDVDFMAKGYWEGSACGGHIDSKGVKYESTPIWEVLYDGALEFID